ncbi:DUF397 domain-containing protein [Nocardia transvalensis]|nr:DUF397 domain-containing protein [Nocardia transvalensis]
MCPHFCKSTYSGANGTCVEVSLGRDSVLIRDSKYAGPADQQPIVSIAPTDWQSFLDLVLSSESGTLPGGIKLSLHPGGGATITAETAALVYSAAEWDAFTKGVADGQFTRRP